MTIQHRNHGRALTLLFIVTNIAIASTTAPATAQSLVSSSFKLDFTIDLSGTFRQAANDNSEQFMREQLHTSDSNSLTPLQKDNSGWSQPIGWLFGSIFVLLGSIVAWSKYTRNRQAS